MFDKTDLLKTDLVNVNINITPTEKFANILLQLVEVAKANAKHNTEPQKEKLLSIKETAELLKVSLPTIWKYRKSGMLPYKRIGKRILFSESEIKETISKIQGKGR